MELYLGGCFQGKLSYVKKRHPECVVMEAKELPLTREELSGAIEKDSQCIINHFHEWIKKIVENKANSFELTIYLIENCPNVIIICDEVGNGIVPMDKVERAYREQTGRMQILIAEKAERVERILCGMGQRLK